MKSEHIVDVNEMMLFPADELKEIERSELLRGERRVELEIGKKRRPIICLKMDEKRQKKESTS